MRISVRKNDPGYHALAHHCCVLLNNRLIQNAFTADGETGEVFCHKYKNGYIVINHKKKEIAQEVKTGTVRIIVPSDIPTTHNRRA